MRYLFAAFLIVGIFIIPSIALTFPDASNALAVALNSALHQVTDELAAVLLYHKPVTVESMKSTYDSAKSTDAPKVRVLIVPGHEPEYGGAEYGPIKERDLAVELSADLMRFLLDDGHFNVFTTRYENSWTPEFENYFSNNWDDITTWEQAHKEEIHNLIRVGKFDPVAPDMYHNDAPDDVAMRLYGIDKWANDNNMDIVIHVHFNDYPRADDQTPGAYTGFSVYVPEKQYFNSSSTKAVADTIFKRLRKYNPVSDLPLEKAGILEDQDLIAIGSFNSVDAASMLIEYSYIYEPQILDPTVRHTFLKELAYETYLGLSDFFSPASASMLSESFDTLTLPHHWNLDLNATTSSLGHVFSQEVFALQSALIDHGDYPPDGSSMNECPRTGKFGPCTKKALTIFQQKNSITDEKGFVGPKTLNELNQLFSGKILN